MFMKHLYYTSIICLLFTSCTPPMYIPNTTNVPTLKEQGDLEISSTFGTNGVDLQTAYSISKDWGAMLNGSYGNYKSDSTYNFNRHSFLEVGVIKTYFLNKKKEEETKSMFILNSGFGYGNGAGRYDSPIYFDNQYFTINQISGDYIRAFVQPSIGFSSDRIDFFFSMRSSYVQVVKMYANSKEVNLNTAIDNSGLSNYRGFLELKNHNIFMEPTITLKAGGQFKGVLQFGTSLGTSNWVDVKFRQRPIIIIFGLQIDLKTKQ